MAGSGKWEYMRIVLIRNIWMQISFWDYVRFGLHPLQRLPFTSHVMVMADCDDKKPDVAGTLSAPIQ